MCEYKYTSMDIFRISEISNILGRPVSSIGCDGGRVGWIVDYLDRLPDHTMPYAVFYDPKPAHISAHWELKESTLNELAGYAFRSEIPFHEYSVERDWSRNTD